MTQAASVIQKLQLQPHPEGGYYRETYRSNEKVTLPDKVRNVSTSIYYLLENENKSHLHRVAHDEIWYFHQGMPLDIISIRNDKVVIERLGNDFSAGEVPQLIVPANTWFAARIPGGVGYSLVSCSVSPGFDFDDFELANHEMFESFSGDREVLSDLIQ